MRLPAQVLSLVAGTVAGAAVAGCGGSQVLSPVRATPTASTPAPTIVAISTPAQPPASNTNQPPPPTTPIVPTTSEPQPVDPMDYAVDCGRG